VVLRLRRNYFDVVHFPCPFGKVTQKIQIRYATEAPFHLKNVRVPL
jgi:hypothetical protein